MVRQSKLKLLILVLISVVVVQNSSTQVVSAADASTLNFFWYDDNSTDLNRTFEEKAISQDEPTWWSLEVNTTNKEWNGKVLYLERYVKNRWEEVMWGSLSEFSGPLPGYNAGFIVDALCGNRTWCSGKIKYRVKSSMEILREFTVTFIPKSSNLKIKLTSAREQAWGTVHTLKAKVNPKINIKCLVERNGENVGTFKVAKGSGALGVTALAYKKPTTGRTTVTLFVVCKNFKYYGVQELNYSLFLP